MLDFNLAFYNPERTFRPRMLSKVCPFCELKITEKIIQQNKKMFILRNKYPYEKGIISEVFVETREHNKELWDFSVEEISEAFSFLQKRVSKIKEKNIVIFKNKGENAAASISHPHMQIVATNKPVKSCNMKKGVEFFKGSFFKTVATNDFNFICEIQPLNPKKFIDITKKEIDEVSFFLKQILMKLKIRNADYNLFIGTKTFFIKIFPRISRLGGLELFTDSMSKSLSLDLTARLYTEKIFKEYDTRGLYRIQINEDMAKSMAIEFVKRFLPKKIVVANDARLGSKPIVHAVLEGLEEAKVEFDYLGDSGTEILNFAVKDYDVGFMVTASHNPSEYTGLKIIGKKEIYMYDNCNKYFETMDFFKYKGKIYEKTKDYTDEYLKRIGKSDKKIVLDFGNGSACFFAKKFFPNAIYLNDNPDGHFPNRSPDPSSDSLKQLTKEVKKRKTWGLAFDGDADRAYYIDEKSRKILPEIIIAFLAQNKKGKIVLNETASWIAKKNIKDLEIAKTGYVYIKKKMDEIGSEFGGEYSGHYYYVIDGRIIDSSLLPTLDIIKLLGNRKLSEIYDKYNKYFSLKSKVPLKKGIIEKFDNYFKEGNKRYLDGLTIEFDDWWFNIRGSNTEPIIKITVEAVSKKKAQEKLKLLEKIAKS